MNPWFLLIVISNMIRCPQKTIWVILLMFNLLNCVQWQEHFLEGEELQAHVLNVGQGLALLVQSDDGEAFLFDAGPDSAEVVALLRQHGVAHLRSVVISHWHRDHVGGLLEILDSIPVDTLWVGMDSCNAWLRYRILAKKKQAVVCTLQVHQQVSLSTSALFHVLRRGAPGDTGNAASVVLRLGGFSGWLLFTGDMGWEQERELLQEGALLQSQILLMPHHGSSHSGCWAFLGAVSPRQIIVSVGKNSYGHPSETTLMRGYHVVADSSDLWRTDLQGECQLNWNPGSGWW